MNKAEIENLEIELLIEAISKRYGYNFQHYARASLKRRINHFLNKMKVDRPTELIPKLLYDESLFESFIFNLSITVTEMFRDPFVYETIRRKVVPILKTYPFIKIWHAGCATGEEAYSMAILLTEEGLYDRTQIYATDFNDIALDKARTGIYPLDQMKTHTANYQKSEGKRSFVEYYHSDHDSAIMKRELRKNITFANHNLVTDTVFGEMHFIMCRNVMIYFDKTLQNRVLQLFYDSLTTNGLLCIGTKESLQFSEVADKLKEIAGKERIYKKKT